MVLHAIAGISYWWIVPAVLIYKFFIIYGSATITSNFFIKANCKAITTEKLIAITFDDGPTSHTKNILQTLSAHKAMATFFVIGKNIQGREQILKQIVSEGHLLGNHTFSHSFFIDFKSVKGFRQELNQTAELVQQLTGKQLNFFRPPYGVTTPALSKAIRQLRYEVIGWNIRSLDTTTDAEDVILKRITRQLQPGSILLFHDASDKTNNVLKQTLLFAKENGFSVVSLEQLLNLKAYH